MIELNRWYEITTTDSVFYRAFVVLVFRNRMKVLYLDPVYDPKLIRKCIGTYVQEEVIECRKITNMRKYSDKVHPDILAKELCKKYGTEVKNVAC